MPVITFEDAWHLSLVGDVDDVRQDFFLSVHLVKKMVLKSQNSIINQYCVLKTNKSHEG